MRYLGYDVSLRETGFCLLDSEQPNFARQSGVIKPPKGMVGPQRLAFFEVVFLKHVSQFQPNAVILEGYSMRSKGRVYNIGELGGVVRLALFKKGIRTYEFPPKSLKGFVTDDGNADKDKMRVKVRDRYGIDFVNDNECDAFGLAMVGIAVCQPEKFPLFLTEKRAFLLQSLEILIHSPLSTNRTNRTRTRV